MLKEVGLIDDQWFDETSRSRGTAVHAEIANIARGFEPFSFLDPDLTGWVQSGIDFLAMLRSEGFEIVAVEKMHYHPLYKFAGEIDLLARKDAREYLYDFKTGKAAKATRFQLAAYSMLLQTSNDKLIKRAAVELQEDGSRARIIEYNSTDNFHDGNRFLSYLNTARDKRLFGPK